MTTRYLICGGRDFADAALMDKALKALILHPWDAVIIHGAAKGADQMAARWAVAHSAHKIEPYPVTPSMWETIGKSAGVVRNQAMLDQGKPDVVIAFPGGNGTADMVRRARARKVVTIVVTGEGGDWYGDADGLGN